MKKHIRPLIFIFLVGITVISLWWIFTDKTVQISDLSGEKKITKKTFSDLDKVPWAKKPVESLVNEGIIEWKPNSSFFPEKDISRADFILMLVRKLGLNAEFDQNFYDVDSGDYYANEAGIARRLGIVDAGGNNLFFPETPILRQDMMLYTVRALNVLNRLKKEVSVSVLDKYKDRYTTSCYAFNSSAALVGEGLILGSGDKLNPKGYATRAAAATLLYRIDSLS